MQVMEADDFVKGLFAALVLKGHSKISIRPEEFDQALAPVFSKLYSVAPEKDIDLHFRIKLHDFHGDSITARNAVYSTVQRGLVSLDNPEFQDITFKFNKERAEKILQRVPGGRQLFIDLSNEFLKEPEAAPA
jgi:hypothetical protein